jgi:hypothetical protein
LESSYLVPIYFLHTPVKVEQARNTWSYPHKGKYKMKSTSRFTKIAVASGLIVATGASVLGITGFASAQVAQRSAAVVAVAEPSGSATKTDPAAPAAPAAGNTSAAAAPTVESEDHKGPGKGAEAVATALGITVEELKTELSSGKSIADVAKAKNVDIAKVIFAMTAQMKAHLDEEVASGEHTQVEADAKLAEFTARATEMVNKAGGPQAGQKGGPGGKHGKGGFVTDALATVLKTTSTDLHTQLRSGKSIADVATAQNVDIADVKAVLTSDFKAHLAEEVTSGEHTQAEADAKLAEFTANLDTMVNRVGPAGGKEGRGHGPRGGREGAPAGMPGAQNTSARA